jgi:3-dehydroquinate synthase
MATSNMTEMLEVNLGDRRYPIVIGPDVLGRQELLLPHVAGNQVCVITDETVAPLYLDRVRAALSAIRQVDAIVIPDGESRKTIATYSSIIDDLMRLRHNRTTTLLALGGGVVGDITGFVAATYQRGVNFIQLPTTLLAQVDSSVGGKTGVNHPQGKNMIGAFHQPVCVLADTGVLSTLPRREYLAGVAEVIKYGIIRDAPFFDWLEARRDRLLQLDQPVLAHAVRTSCAIKAAVVESDEREGGLRAILNYGHTFGHAIEALTQYQEYLHGEAVAIGMVMAADLSFRHGWLGRRDAAKIRHLVEAMGLPSCPPRLGAEAFLDAMGMDKKVVDGRLRFVILHALGDAAVSDAIDPVLLHQTLDAYESLCDE